MPLEIRGTLEEPPHYVERPVRFSLSKCDVDKYCIKNLDRQELLRLYATLGKFENLTWGQVQQMPREKGISIDKKDSSVYELLKNKVTGCTTFGHFRVTGSSANTRVFIGLNRDLAFIGLIDREGNLQH